jgi:hypothetical protein
MSLADVDAQGFDLQSQAIRDAMGFQGIRDTRGLSNQNLQRAAIGDAQGFQGMRDDRGFRDLDTRFRAAGLEQDIADRSLARRMPLTGPTGTQVFEEQIRATQAGEGRADEELLLRKLLGQEDIAGSQLDRQIQNRLFKERITDRESFDLDRELRLRGLGQEDTRLSQQDRQFGRGMDLDEQRRYDQVQQERMAREQQAGQFGSELGFRREGLTEQARQFGVGLDAQKDQFGRDLDFRGQAMREQARQFGVGLDAQKDQFGRDLDFRRDSRTEQARQFGVGLDAQKDQFGRSLGEQGRQFDLQRALEEDRLTQQGVQFGRDLGFRQGQAEFQNRGDVLAQLLAGREADLDVGPSTDLSNFLRERAGLDPFIGVGERPAFQFRGSDLDRGLRRAGLNTRQILGSDFGEYASIEGALQNGRGITEEQKSKYSGFIARMQSAIDEQEA